MNNFKKIGEENEDRFPVFFEEKKVSSNYYFLRHVGNVVDHFLGRTMDMFISFSGGDAADAAGPKAPPDQGNDPFEDVPPMRH
ncbi:MAG: hypothetical protein ACJAT4_001970 [Granulosicoccus sp.]|jgi:hypothetical protein